MLQTFGNTLGIESDQMEGFILALSQHGLIEPEKVLALQEFDSTFNKLKDIAENGSDDVKAALAKLQGMTRDKLKDIKISNGKIDSQELIEYENALQTLGNALGLTTEDMEMFFDLLEAGGVLETEQSQ